MASFPIFTVGDGVIEIPEELQSDPRLKKGSRLRLVASSSAVILEPEEVSIQAKGDWRRLRGVLAHVEYSLNDELEAEKQRELRADERMMRGSVSEQ